MYQIHVVVVSPRHHYIVKSASLRVNSILGVVGRIVRVSIFLEILWSRVQY